MGLNCPKQEEIRVSSGFSFPDHPGLPAPSLHPPWMGGEASASPTLTAGSLLSEGRKLLCCRPRAKQKQDTEW